MFPLRFHPNHNDTASCILPDAKPKICVLPGAKPKRKPVEYRFRGSQRKILAMAMYISCLLC